MMSKDLSDELERNSGIAHSEDEKKKRFFELKAELELAVAEAEAGALQTFDPAIFEPDAYF